MKVVVFDLDGTLFRADAVTVPAVQRALASRGLPAPPEEEIVQFIGRPTPELHAWLESLCPPGTGGEVARDVDRLEVELVRRCGRLYEGIPQALERILKFADRLAICTNGPRYYVDAVLDGHGLRRYFHRVRCLEREGDTKQSMLREVLEDLQARTAVMVGDRREDVEAARACGVPCVGAAYGLGGPEQVRLADRLARSPADIPALVRELLDGAA